MKKIKNAFYKMAMEFDYAFYEFGILWINDHSLKNEL